MPKFIQIETIHDDSIELGLSWISNARQSMQGAYNKSIKLEFQLNQVMQLMSKDGMKNGHKNAIWHSAFPIALANEQGATCANGRLGIEIVEAGMDFLAGRMPVDERTKQPAGILHGGVSVAFAETLASWAAAQVVDPEKFFCVGQEINANHVRSVRSGWVNGVAHPLHLGKSSHVWEVKITDEEGKLVCISRVTIAVLKRAIEAS